MTLVTLTYHGIVGVIVSTAQNPSSFNNFTQAVPFFQATGEGDFCFPINLASSGVSGLSDGVNATLQIVFDGGDDKLYQVGISSLPTPSTRTNLAFYLLVCRCHFKQQRDNRLECLVHQCYK